MAGRKSLIKEWEAPDKLDELRGMRIQGLTLEEIAEHIGITYQTIYNWCKQSESISLALKKGKKSYDARMVYELYKSGIGRIVTVRKAIKLKYVDYDEMTGKKCAEREEVQFVDEEQYIKGDTVAQIFYLKNQLPDQFSDRQNLAVEGEGRETGVILLAPVMEDAPADAPADAPVEADPQA